MNRRELLAAMADSGVNNRGIQLDISYPTDRVMVHMEGNKHHFKILPEQAYDYIHAGLTHLVTLAVRPELIYFGTLAQRSARSAQALTALTRSNKAPHLLDIDLREPWYDTRTIKRSMKRANMAKLNQEELDTLALLFRLPGKNHQDKASALVRRFALGSILVPCGEQGAWQLDNKGKAVRIEEPAKTGRLVDTV